MHSEITYLAARARLDDLYREAEAERRARPARRRRTPAPWRIDWQRLLRPAVNSPNFPAGASRQGRARPRRDGDRLASKATYCLLNPFHRTQNSATHPRHNR